MFKRLYYVRSLRFEILASRTILCALSTGKCWQKCVAINGWSDGQSSSL